MSKVEKPKKTYETYVIPVEAIIPYFGMSNTLPKILIPADIAEIIEINFVLPLISKGYVKNMYVLQYMYEHITIIAIA